MTHTTHTTHIKEHLERIQELLGLDSGNSENIQLTIERIQAIQNNPDSRLEDVDDSQEYYEMILESEGYDLMMDSISEEIMEEIQEDPEVQEIVQDYVQGSGGTKEEQQEVLEYLGTHTPLECLQEHQDIVLSYPRFDKYVWNAQEELFDEIKDELLEFDLDSLLTSYPEMFI